jgi:lipopolysaccharide export LptBFGC system permease protein LptF
MIYKTLHWYILKELLRIFLLTSAALTTLLAFCGLFKPLTKQGIEVTQLMWILFNLMPAMLAYAIPMGALFAAVVVYWRLSTDNEVTACRAGGVSFWMVLFPALILGLAVASVDLVFVNYVVPVFLKRTEETLRKDLATVLVHNVARREPFQWGKLVIYADEGRQEVISKEQTPPGVDRRSIVILKGMAAAQLDPGGKPGTLIVARQANVVIDEYTQKDEVRIQVQVEEGAAFDPKTFQQIRGTIRSIPPQIIPSMFKDKAKFLNYIQLRHLEKDKTLYGPIDDKQDSVLEELHHQQIARKYLEKWYANHTLRFEQANDEYLVIRAPVAGLGEERQLNFARTVNTPVVVEQYRKGKLVYFYKCDTADFFLTDAAVVTSTESPEVIAGLRLSGPVFFHDMVRGIPEAPAETPVLIQPLTVPDTAAGGYEGTLSIEEIQARKDFTPHVRKLVEEMEDAIKTLGRTIGSELHSRGSFALSCLTLVLFGGALGIMMRGRNPLMVFVVGFVPAIVLVLLITAGRRVVETAHGTGNFGYVMIWAGNIFLLFLVVTVYSKLLRQ